MTETIKTESVARRLVENVAMGGLLGGARLAVHRAKVQDVVRWSERAADLLRCTAVVPEKPDTLMRGRALAYRWSAVVPGATCLHRALATRVWLAAVGIDSRVVLGFRKRPHFEGHAWLEVYLEHAATLLFVDDRDGYDVAISG